MDHPILISLLAWMAMLAATMAPAAQPARRHHQIEINQGSDSAAVVYDTSRRNLGSLQSKELGVTVAPADSVQLHIADPNPVLFNYAGDVVVTGPTESYSAALAFAQAITDFLAANPVATEKQKSRFAGNQLQPTGVLYIDAVDLGKLLAELSKLRTVEATLRDAALASLRGTRAETATFREALRTLAKDTSRTVATLDELRRLELKTGVSEPNLTYSIRGVPRPVIAVARNFRELQASLEKQFNAAAPSDQSLFKDAIDQLYAAQLCMDRIDEMRRLVDLLQDFSKAYAGVKEPYSFGPVVTYDAKNNQKLTLRITANEHFQEVLAELAPEALEVQKNARTTEFALTPEEKYALRIGGGLIYSFVNEPEFAVADTDGNLSITQTSDDYKAVQGAVVLNISKASSEGYGARPFAQIGLVPSSDDAAVMLGVGFRAYDRFAFSLGAIYQRTERLKAGLTVGQALSSADELQVERKYKAGLFVMLSATLE